MSSSVAAKRSAGTPDVSSTLGVDPGRWVDVPFVLAVGDGRQRRLYLVPAALVIQRPSDGLGDEGASSPTTDSLVELCDKLVRQAYVQTHGHKLTHISEA